MSVAREIPNENSVLPRVNFTKPFYRRQVRIASWSYGISIVVHGTVFFIMWYFSFLLGASTGDFIVRSFPEAPPGQVLYNKDNTNEMEKISKFFSIDFVPTLDTRRTRYVEEPTPPEPEPEPKPVEKPPEPEPAVVEPVEEGVPEYVRPEVKTYSIDDPDANYILFPDIELTDVFGQPFRAQNLFGPFDQGGRTAVIVFCDVSREQGYNDLTLWADMWVKFLGVRGLGELPHVICIGNIIEDPYAHPIEYYETGLKLVFEDYRDQIQYYTQSFEVTGVIDVHSEILRAISDEMGENVMGDLRKPLLMLVDNWGVVRVMMWGRPVDISGEEIDKVGSIIREIWSMKDWEYALFKGLILKMQADQKQKEGLE